VNERVETLVVGAGPAGLAVAACLRRAGREFVVVEQLDSVGARWRSRYRRLHLHTAKQYSGLPHLPFPKSAPRYPSRDEVVAYLESYGRHFGIEPRVDERVVALSRDDGGWRASTSGGSTYHAQHIVLCTGRSDVPHRPHWPGDDTFPGEILHSADFVSGERFAGKRVLVVGLGNSGGEIALDLAENGARPDIAVRSAVNIVPRDFLGQPIQRSTIVLSRVPLAIRDRVGRLISRLVFGDLAALGLPPAPEGPVSQIAHRGRIPLIDVGTVALVRAGRIGLRRDVARFAGDRVDFADGSYDRYDAVVLATGYRAGVAALTAGLGVLPENGYPASVTHPATPGLYFVGFRTPPTGHLRQIAIDARRVASDIVAARAPWRRAA
jgi:indole-3-pyruvate monooxygenase